MRGALARAALLLVLGTGAARAQGCPGFFRFVDFGQEARDGQVYRGGPTFRAESLEGAPLLLRERTECRDLRDTAVDGHGNPIPVVTRVHYRPGRTGAGLTALHLRVSADAVAEAEKHAEEHRARLARPEARVTRGADFLCVEAGEEDAVSCQIVSPYPGNAALIVRCDAMRCAMPAMAIHPRILAGADWPRPAETRDDPAATGRAIGETAAAIRAFLDPLSS